MGLRETAPTTPPHIFLVPPKYEKVEKLGEHTSKYKKYENLGWKPSPKFKILKDDSVKIQKI